MQTPVLILLLAAVFSLFIPTVQTRLQDLLRQRPGAIWAVPFLLTAVFSGAAALAGASTVPLTLAVLVYTLAPVAAAVMASRRAGDVPNALDFLAIALIWLPMEFAAGKALVPRPVQGYLHSVAYGIAIVLGVILFLGVRAFKGMKYNGPRGWRDLWLALAGFAIVAPILILVGIPIGFIPPPHWSVQPGGRMAAAVGIVFAGTALPEEILFRSLIQNLIMLRFGKSVRTLVIASFIFGCAHLDNGPQAVPNWRYMILATVAGLAYGKVFEMGSTVLASAALHTMVDWTKHFFF